MFIETRQDMVRAAYLIMNGDLEPNDISFAEHITDTIKIISDEWNDAKNIDYKTSQLILSVQKDVIGIYNYIFKTNISLKNISQYNFLIVKFTVTDGCLEYKSKLKIKEIIDSLSALAKDVKQMPMKNLIALGFILFAVAGAWKAPEIIHEIKRNPNTAEILKSNNDIIAKNQHTSTTIINNLGNGSVIYNGKETTADEYKENMIQKEKIDIAPVLIEDRFHILQYDFKNQKAQLFQPGVEPFWASTKWLPQDAREELQTLTSNAIENGTIAIQKMVLSCKIKDKKIIESAIEYIKNIASSNAKDLKSVLLNTHQKREKAKPLSLLDMKGVL